jgi:hypothetical protein
MKYTVVTEGAKVLAVLQNGHRAPAPAGATYTDNCRLTNRPGRGSKIVAVGSYENPIVGPNGRRWNFAVTK